MENKAQQETETVGCECPMCGGTGGWPGIGGWVVCRPCNGTGAGDAGDTEEPA